MNSGQGFKLQTGEKNNGGAQMRLKERERDGWKIANSKKEQSWSTSGCIAQLTALFGKKYDLFIFIPLLGGFRLGFRCGVPQSIILCTRVKLQRVKHTSTMYLVQC